MDFRKFSQQISKIENLPLPGVDSHYKMAPQSRIKELESYFQKKKNPKKAGVLALFYPKKDVTHLLLILRKKYPGVHSNQISFPGGKFEESDRDLLGTALRESAEEVGVVPGDIQIVRALSEIYITPSNFDVQPYLGLYEKKEPFIIQETEVEALVEVPVLDFLNEANIIQSNLSTSYALNIEVPAFDLQGHTVWGATAMMLSEIKDLFKKVL
jgi:8-oxo-dGTP pyrophosphatase MutT (NUDIX family)